MNFLDFVTHSLKDYESDEYRNIRWSLDYLKECMHLAMMQLQVDLLDVFTVDKTVTLARGTCYQVDLCGCNGEEDDCISGKFVKLLMVDGQSCVKPSTTSKSTNAIIDLLQGSGKNWGLDGCDGSSTCQGPSPLDCLTDSGYTVYDPGGYELDLGQNGFWTNYPTPDDRDVEALIRCSIVPNEDEIDDWLADDSNLYGFNRVKYLIIELMYWYAYEKDDEIPERDKMMTMHMNAYIDKRTAYTNTYAKEIFHNS